MSRLNEQLRAMSADLPASYWYLWIGTVINRLGGFVVPFLSLYLTKKLKFSMTEVGFNFGFFAVMSVISQILGGVLADRWGRKPVMLISLQKGGIDGAMLQDPTLFVAEDNGFKTLGDPASMETFFSALVPKPSRLRSRMRMCDIPGAFTARMSP